MLLIKNKIWSTFKYWRRNTVSEDERISNVRFQTYLFVYVYVYLYQLCVPLCWYVRLSEDE